MFDDEIRLQSSSSFFKEEDDNHELTNKERDDLAHEHQRQDLLPNDHQSQDQLQHDHQRQDQDQVVEAAIHAHNHFYLLVPNNRSLLPLVRYRTKWDIS